MRDPMGVFGLHSVDDPKEAFIKESVDDSKLPPLGRVYSILLSAKLQNLQSPSVGNCTVNSALVSLLQHMEFASQKGISFSKFFLPLLSHAVKSKHRNHRKQVITILEWLLEKDSVGTAIVDGLVEVLRSEKADHQIKLGWCMVVHHFMQERLQKRNSSGFVDVQFKHVTNCLPDLLNIMSEASPQGVPTRLSAIAADCFILISRCMGIQSPQPIEEHDIDFDSSYSRNALTLNPDASTSGRKTSEKEELLWEQLDVLLQFVLIIKKWNETRPLYVTGLGQVLQCLEKLIHYRDAINQQNGGEEDLMILKTTLVSYWEQYSMLMLMDTSTVHINIKLMLQQWIEGLQFSLQTRELEGDFYRGNRETEEIRIFFLTCLALLLGRLNATEMEEHVREYSSVLLQALFGQLHGKHDAVDLAVGILRTFLFQSNLLTDMKMRTIAPLLMDLLNERDSISSAAVALIADYFAINPCAFEMENLFSILDSDNTVQRRNALAVISELLNTLSSSEHDMTNTVRQNIAVHLLKRLGDVELENRIAVSQLFAKLDPTFVLPDLVQKVYSNSDRVRSAASSSIVSILKGQRNSPSVLFILLDCTSNVIRKKTSPPHPGCIGTSSNERTLQDADRIMQLIPSWASEVEDWDHGISLILEKMFSDPSNPIMPRFLNQISKYLLDNVRTVFRHVYLFMSGQYKIGVSYDTNDPQVRQASNIFIQLSPLLVLRVLPLAAFDDVTCEELYGGQSEESIKDPCIVCFLMNRLCGECDAHEVKKLSAELLGRCIPNVILPVLAKKLQNAIDNKAIMEVNAFIFSLCNLIFFRKKAALDHPSIRHIQSSLYEVLLWPCPSTDEDTFKAQHGCIDCFSLMVVEEIANYEFVEGTAQRSKCIEEIPKGMKSNEVSELTVKLQLPILSWVISNVTGEKQTTPFLSDRINDSGIDILVPFRICMANILIRAAQKVKLKHRTVFVSRVLPPILHFLQVTRETPIKSASLQILFSMVHNFENGIKSYAVDLLNFSLKILRSNGPTEERIAAARLLATLIASTDDVIAEIAPFLPDVMLVVESISRMDSSMDLRLFCEKLRECMSG